MTNRKIAFGCWLWLAAAWTWAQPPEAAVSPNTLSRAERAAGWKLLFDGKSTDAWRGYRKQAFPDKGWVVENGALKCVEKGGGGDIVTKDQFGDFELELEFKVSPKGNSGIMYRVAETQDASWQTGVEFQVLDDAGAGLAPGDWHASGAAYELYQPPPSKPVKPAGEWNQARVIVRDGWVQHFLNGVKTAEFQPASEDFKKRVAASKFASYQGFGTQPKGFVALQDHGNNIWFRSIKIRDLRAAMPGEEQLFNGKDLTGWTAFLDGKGKAEDVWSVLEGVLICKGNPVGYIRTNRDYTDFVLKLEWRFNPVTKKAGNSGVLLRVQPPDKVWPKSVEAQLQSENAGDFWNIDEFPMKTDPQRLNGRNTKKTHGAERPLGEWNEYEIIVDGSNVVLKVNGEELNRAWDVAKLAGKIALQSEGAEIHFRKIRLAPIE